MGRTNRLWPWVLSLLLLCCSNVGPAADSGNKSKSNSSRKSVSSYDKMRDVEKARDKKIPAKPLDRERVVNRYTSKKFAKEEMRKGIPPNTHMTSRATRGRPLSPSEAKRRFGLKSEPQVRETIVLPKRQPVRTEKVMGGKRGVGGLTSTKPVPPSAIKKVIPITESKKKTR